MTDGGGAAPEEGYEVVRRPIQQRKPSVTRRFLNVIEAATRPPNKKMERSG